MQFVMQQQSILRLMELRQLNYVINIIIYIYPLHTYMFIDTYLPKPTCIYKTTLVLRVLHDVNILRAHETINKANCNLAMPLATHRT